MVQCVNKAALGQSLDNDTFLAMVDLAEATIDVVPSDTEFLGLRAVVKDHLQHLFHAAKWNVSRSGNFHNEFSAIKLLYRCFQRSERPSREQTPSSQDVCGGALWIHLRYERNCFNLQLKKFFNTFK